MKIIGYIFTFASRLILLIAGILLLLITIPHKDPWNMSLVSIKGDKGQEITISFPIKKDINIGPVQFPIKTSAKKIFKTTGLCLIGLTIITSSGRKVFINYLKNPKYVPAFLVSMAMFVFTLKPTQSGMPIVLYTTLGGLGVLFCSVGIFPLVNSIGRRSPGKFIYKVSVNIVNFILNMRIELFLLIVFALAFTATNLGSYYLFEHIPHIQDSLDQVFHGKIFSIGKLTVPSHKYKEFFDFTHMINDGRWYSEYPPGHSFLMMFGVMMGIPWIINPLLGSLTVVVFYFLGKELYDEKTGRLSALLGLFSPFIIFMSSEFMSHASALFWLSLFVLFFARSVKYRKNWHPLVAGSALGMALNGRPLTSLGICFPFAIYALVLLIKRFREYIVRLSIMLITILVFLFILLLFNYLTTGDAMLFGYVVKHGEGHNPGFGHSGWGEPHTPSKGLRQNLNNLNALNKYLFEWPIPCLFFMFLLFISMTRNKWDYMLLGAFWCLSISYFFYWFQDWCFGPRFMYESTLATVILTSRSLIRTPKLVNDIFGLKTSLAKSKGTVGFVIIFCFAIGLSFHIKPLVNIYSNNYWGVNASVLKAVKSRGIKNAVIFVQSYYGSVLPANSPTFDGDIIYVRDLGATKNRKMMEYYPHREYYRANGSNIQKLEVPAKGQALIEAESLEVIESSGDGHGLQNMLGFGLQWSSEAQVLVYTNSPGDYIVLPVYVDEVGNYEISACFTKAPNFARIQLIVNGKPLGELLDTYNKNVIYTGIVEFGTVNLIKGDNRFKFLVVDKNKSSSNYLFGVDCIIIKKIQETDHE
ncbi:hypothetical protein GF312_11795 [Candidatus Poribacteria bacterium]|nr:hypothetical protein [Candidatus Poribacteria bacterium]